MVDDSMYTRYNRGAEKSLQPLDRPISGRPEVSLGPIFGLDDPDDFDVVNAPPVYQAMRHAMLGARRRAARVQSQTKSKSAR